MINNKTTVEFGNSAKDDRRKRKRKLVVSRRALRVDAREGELRKLVVMALRWPITNRVYTDSAGFHVSSPSIT